MNIILALLVLGVVIFIHEFGHFIVAKANGVTVVEFYIGFGPKIIHFRKGETEYSLRLIPFGGACVMLGDDLLAEDSKDRLGDDAEDVEDETEDSLGTLNDKSIRGDDSHRESAAETLKKKLQDGFDESKSFANKNVWSRIAIIAAGPFFNFLLAFVLAIVIIVAVGVDPCKVDIVEAESPAATAGLKVGDEIVKINNNSISFAKEYSFHMYYHADETMKITYIRDGNKYTTTVEPVLKHYEDYMVGITISRNSLINSVTEGGPADKAGLKAGDIVTHVAGVELSEERLFGDILDETKGKQVELKVLRDGENITLSVTPELVESDGYYTGFDCYGYREKVSAGSTVIYAVKEVAYWIETVVKSVGMMFTGQVGIDDLSGPVGVVDAVNTVVEQSKPDGAYYVMLNLFNFMVMISANLGVMNLLPLPALDGGRLVFMFIEVLRGKPVKKEHEGMVHFVGVVLLMILMVYVLIKDIRGLF